MVSSFAKKAFGTQDPIGQTIGFKMGEKNYQLTVVGVMADFPSNTHLNNQWDAFDIMISEETYKSIAHYQPEWNINDLANQTYVKLEKGFDLQSTEEQLNSLLVRRAADELTYAHYLQSVTDIYLNTKGLPIGAEGNVTQVYVFSLIGLLILSIACVNYINLTTARVTMRMKEVGVRKLLGAGRKQVVWQFVIEAFLISISAIVLAVCLVYWALPTINSSFDLHLTFSLFSNVKMMVGLLLILIILCLCAGGSLGYYLSKFTPVRLLKAKISVAGRKFSLRTMLVVFQFGISAAMIICTLVIVDQLQYMMNKSLGFEKEGVAYIPVPFREMAEKNASLKASFDKIPQVTSLSLTGSSLGEGQLLYQNIQQTAEGEGAYLFTLPVDFDYAETMGLKLKQGRWFDPEMATDMDGGFVVNEAFVKRLGVQSPLGTTLYRNGQEGKIIGVAEDFNFKSLRSEIDPLVMHMMKDYAWNYTNLAVKLKPGNKEAAIQNMQEAWKEVFPNRSFEWHFLDQQLEANYRKDIVFGRIFQVFALIAIAISCLGLLGLVSFSVERKSQEIGVRKVLGASVTDILIMVSREFSVLILIGFALSVPLAYYFLNQWLSDFQFRIDMGFVPFVLAGVITLVIAWFTVSYVSLRAAKTNPVNVLKQE